MPGGYYDFNGNGQIGHRPAAARRPRVPRLLPRRHPEPRRIQNGGTYVYTLNGVSGFADNPLNPFLRENPLVGASLTASSDRVEPFFEFRADRLVDDDFDGIPGYVDPLGTGDQSRYFAYFSSYQGGGYDPNDVNLAMSTEQAPSAMGFLITFPVVDGSGNVGRATVSPLPNPYTSGLPTPAGGSTASFKNPQSYQIISAGRDRLYGVGGQYDETNTTTRLPINAPPPATTGPASGTTSPTSPTARSIEAEADPPGPAPDPRRVTPRFAMRPRPERRRRPAASRWSSWASSS